MLGEMFIQREFTYLAIPLELLLHLVIITSMLSLLMEKLIRKILQVLKVSWVAARSLRRERHLHHLQSPPPGALHFHLPQESDR